MSDVLIIGGGLSGAAAATLLARAGKAVHLLERHASPVDKVCGEFLSIEAQQHLKSLGIDLDHMGAVKIDRLRLVSGGKSVESPLPFVARGISRRLLDEALLEQAKNAGAKIERGVRVSMIEGDRAKTNVGDRIGNKMMLATGKLPVRGERLESEAPVENGHVGFKMHFRLNAQAQESLADVIELALFPGGYAGLQMVDSKIANLCLVMRQSQFTALGSHWTEVMKMVRSLSPALAMLADAEPLFTRPHTVANLAYGRIPGNNDRPDLYRLGDQAAMTASLTGDGMAIALRSAFLAARCISEGLLTETYHSRLRDMVGTQIRRGMIIQRLSEASLMRGLAMPILKMRPSLLRTVTQLTRLPEMVLT